MVIAGPPLGADATGWLGLGAAMAGGGDAVGVGCCAALPGTN